MLLPLADKINVDDLLIYLLVLVLAGLFAWIKRAATKSSRGKQSAAHPPPAPRPPPRPPAIPRRPPAQRAPTMLRAAQPRWMPGVGRPAVRRPPASQPEMQPVSWDVIEEMRRELTRLQQADAERVQRMATAAPAEADTAAIEARLVTIRPAAGPLAAAEVRALLADLKTPDALRRAILHYEVFAPPKALRPGPEMWDL
jgi:hypothetical protein